MKNVSFEIYADKLRDWIESTKKDSRVLSKSMGFCDCCLSKALSLEKISIRTAGALWQRYGLSPYDYAIDYEVVDKYFKDFWDVKNLREREREREGKPNIQPSVEFIPPQNCENDDLILFLKAIDRDITAYLNILEKKGEK